MAITFDDSMRLVVEAVQNDVSHEEIARIVGAPVSLVYDCIAERAKLSAAQYRALLRHLRSIGAVG